MKKEKQVNSLQEKLLAKEDYELTSDPKVWKEIIQKMIRPLKKVTATKVVALDMKGLLYGPIIAYQLGLPFIPILKGGKLKKKRVVRGKAFKDYSKKTKSIEIIKGSIQKGDKTILVDDWFETGNTAKAAIHLIEKMGGKVIAISVIFNQLSKENEEYFSRYYFNYIKKLEPKKS